VDTARLERLATPADLAEWLVAGGVLDAPPVTDDDLTAARELRGALYEVVVALEAGRPVAGLGSRGREPARRRGVRAAAPGRDGTARPGGVSSRRIRHRGAQRHRARHKLIFSDAL
jgi:Putative stress-induced transcription regulator